MPFAALELPWTEPVTGAQLDAALAADAAISHVIVCHVDTGTGLLNPIEPLAEVARRRGVALIVDAIASFGGLPIDAAALDLEAIVASPNKWLEGLPGIGLVVVKRTALAAAAGRAHSFCLDLHRQWQSFEHDGRWRFTPPAQATAALVAALRQHEREGQAARLERVRRNWRCLVDGLRALGLETYLRDEVASPVIATFYAPADPNYDPERLFELMWRQGFAMFRGRLTPEPTFRIGCMGAIDEAVMREVVRAIATSLAAMGVRDCRPAAAPRRRRVAARRHSRSAAAPGAWCSICIGQAPLSRAGTPDRGLARAYRVACSAPRRAQARSRSAPDGGRPRSIPRSARGRRAQAWAGSELVAQPAPVLRDR